MLYNCHLDLNLVNYFCTELRVQNWGKLFMDSFLKAIWAVEITLDEKQSVGNVVKKLRK